MVRRATILLFSVLALSRVSSEEAFERPPIAYSAATPHDAVSVLEARLAQGRLHLDGDDRQVIRALLAAFGIPETSQMLVFSKTSFQKDRIDPVHPRALYFSDDVYVGWCPGGLAEITAIDPVLGPVFYRFDPRAPAGQRRFARDSDCLRCHGGAFIHDIPALLARSVYPGPEGQPFTGLGSELVDGSTPLEQRWGGWYVTGLHGSARHRGNLVLTAEREPTAADLARGSNLKSLDKLVDTTPYLTRSSDLVALLIFEHQLAVQNAFTKANQHCLQMLAYQQGVQRDLKETPSEQPAYDSVKHAFTEATQQLMDALLFKDEAPLPSGGVSGIGGFARAFTSAAKPAPNGRSFKELDLQTRLFKYRCSYLIQSESFTRLQPVLRRWVLQGLWHVLSDPSPPARYGYLESDERSAIRAMIKSLVPNLPPCWMTSD